MITADEKTLFERIGGKPAVDAAVNLFYDKILSDDRVNYFFRDIEVKRQIGKQKAFLTYAFGGAPGYSGLPLRKAHARLVSDMGMNDTHFDIVAGHLQTTLEELNVPEDIIVEVMEIAGSTRDDVLNR